METQIKDSLIALLSAIKAADGQAIAAEIVKVEEYLERGRSQLRPQLVHFLENRSYAKALVFLGGESLGAQGFTGRPAASPLGCNSLPSNR